MAIDAFDKEINIGDTVIVARAWGRSCSLAAGIVVEIKPNAVHYEVVMDKGVSEKPSEKYAAGGFIGDICFVRPYNGKGEKYDKLVNVGYGFDHDSNNNVIGDLFVR